MNSLINKALKLLIGDDVNFDLTRIPKNRPLKPLTERELLKLESAIGAELFGPVPQGHRREFFCLDHTTWIWHEEWIGDDRKLQTSTVKYEINQHGVLKTQEGARYSYLDGDELQNFAVAIRMYYERVAREVYGRDPATGQKLV
ncbi:hypothetical protein IPM09_00780 [Candidatus Saccharibacteria bacterium]|nr:MAG: hypothetical protein IPM09_00780 [Candidatus Saccharibacteria bacterium]